MTHSFSKDKSSSTKKPMLATSYPFPPPSSAPMTQQGSFYPMGHTQNYLRPSSTSYIPHQGSTSHFIPLAPNPSYFGMHQDVPSAPHSYPPSSSSSSPYYPGSAPLPQRMQSPTYKLEPLDMSDLLSDMAQWQTSTTSSDFPPSQMVSPYSGGVYSPNYFTAPNAPAFVSPLSQISTPSPSSSPSHPPPLLPSIETQPRRQSVDSAKSCSHCHVTSTPLWRREPGTLRPLCNACGLYLQQRNRHRPQELIDADNDDESDGSGDGTGPECSHCHTHNTSVWRRSKTGDQLCNACGVYSRLKGKDRPLSLKRNKIKPRSKHTPPSSSK